MNTLSADFLENIFTVQKENSLHGKWITYKDIEHLFYKYESQFVVSQIGTSEENRPIHQLQVGTGSKKILLWSQMHGNESTGTKALFDLFNCIINSSEEIFSKILKECTLVFIPMLNPDGAQVYTRVNANQIDLNRDAVDRVAKESKLLRNILEGFNPQFCFNLHDQRTIFNVEGTKNAATISFLAPSEEVTRALTKGRTETMNVIVSMNKMLQNVIPDYVGRYTDEFYPTATGDNFQKLGYNTILIESGHYPDDYDREESRKYTFFSILQGIHHIANTLSFDDYEAYFDIPNNDKIFYDIIHRYSDSKNDIAYQYEDKIIDGKFVSKLNKVDEKVQNSNIGHSEIVFEGKII
ncbi:M14 family zinc carboxypeptidase [Polaribacter sp. Hel1_85]|uniref:M14 family zinc carboxypeptidase n=1 Tax=Polaribacter sp. Hel1_85 TaxID=1250005 RepID=UPI00052BE753|nr:M14 family zinc carboxypeptidase [Polaribacter sp. Hel1_85]KGL63496.1 zinc carboxypeptidase [Polaribacter sp. Hel1_85]